jgi:hypothetical protein
MYICYVSSMSGVIATGRLIQETVQTSSSSACVRDYKVCVSEVTY